MKPYDFKNFEVKWRKFWEDNGLHQCHDEDPRPKHYCLDMFPYPSGSGLHVGHWRGYVLSDVWSRYKILQGYNVLHPMGWDAFGLPAENDAIKKKTHPRINTERNIDNMKRQLKEIGAVYDWSREFATTDTDYYHWTQWLFLRFYKRGLLYRSEIPINWCPSCKCGLANEEVVGGRCERCSTETDKQNRMQWLMKITAYADRLLSDIDGLNWPEKVKMMQRNWIGRSEGGDVIFTIIDNNQNKHPVSIFTTRPDTLWGATFLVLAPEHPLVQKITTAENRKQVEGYITNARKIKEIDRAAADREKTGVNTGAVAINPVNGDEIPVWISDYVLMEYGTGAIMSVPAHDERDFAFAKKFDIPIIKVVDSKDAVCDEKGELLEAYIGHGTLINTGHFSGKDSESSKKEIINWLEQKGLGKWVVQYHLRDWVFSRQRYWGEPIPIIHCDKCGEVPVPEEDLPILLPDIEHYEVTGTGDSPLANITEWVNTTCPKCKGPAKRETDTMPQWAGSCWYFLRFASPHEKTRAFDPEVIDQWLPVDMYVGGIEHAVLHLLYARFFTKFLFDEGLLTFNEPFTRLFNQGMVGRKSYRCDHCRKWIPEEEVKDKDRCPTCGGLLEIKANKMSKSKANAVSSDELVQKYGTDSVRLYELFMGPPDIDVEWSTHGIEGCFRFLNRYFNWVNKVAEGIGQDTTFVTKARHILVKNISERIEGLRFNTAVSAFMEFLNAVERIEPKDVSMETLKAVTTCLAPFAPHMAEELWFTVLGGTETIFKNQWPTWDEALTKSDEIEIPVQINGKLRTTFTVPADTDDDTLREKVVLLEEIQKHISGKTITKIIVVPKRLINIVVTS